MSYEAQVVLITPLSPCTPPPSLIQGAYGAIETYIQLHEAATKAAAAKAEAANGASAEDAKK